jgi:hypothetical protein
MEFWKHLNWFTIVSGLLTLFGAVLTFLLSQLDLKDKRKNFLGMKPNAVKDLAAYLTLFFAFLTLFVQSRHDYLDSEEKRRKEKQADDKQRASLTLTLKTIDSTLVKQQITQDSTQILLDSQKTELRNEARLINNINTNLGLSYRTQKTVNSLNFPIGNTVGATCTIRLYLKGFSELVKDSVNQTHILLEPNQNIEQFIDSRVSKMTQTRIIPYWRFFFSCSQNGFDHVMAITAKPTKVIFNQLAGVDAASGSFLSQSQIFYNPAQSYLEFKLLFPAGIVASNSENTTDFTDLIDHAHLYIMIRYVAEKNVQLPANMDDNKTVSIDHVEIAAVNQINYGTQFQDVLPARSERITTEQKLSFMKSLFNKDILPGELWRYDIAQVPIRAPRTSGH